MSGSLSRLLGDSPVRVVLKLLLASLIVGLTMATFGWTPYDVFYELRNLLMYLWEMGFSAFDRFLGYILLGAAIVVPAFIILRLLSYRRG